MSSGLSQSQIISAIMDAISALWTVNGGASYYRLEEIELEELVNRVQEDAPTTALNEEEPPQPSTSGQGEEDPEQQTVRKRAEVGDDIPMENLQASTSEYVQPSKIPKHLPTAVKARLRRLEYEVTMTRRNYENMKKHVFTEYGQKYNIHRNSMNNNPFKYTEGLPQRRHWTPEEIEAFDKFAYDWPIRQWDWWNMKGDLELMVELYEQLRQIHKIE
ncbi:solute carrier family 1 protein [Echinococcus multilocularis]|uniref:Solute carrier family 1 protein n=1 Tax=Echinococcus multilocularis TaxID=6211 RepID=A0A0S4MM67_ECHMU|nr:solute carrier family 1 protein [Echinococcus multilocularis]